MSERSHLIKAALSGLFVVAAGLGAGLTPLALELEQNIGLDWLFQLRGPRTPPAKVVVVSIDRESSDRLGLSNKPWRWPRSLHADLVGKLATGGAAVIAFDIIFEQSRDPADDQEFADAIRQAGNVVLFEYLERETPPSADESAPVNIEQRVPPIPVLADAAAALAPFPLPKVPTKVSQVFLFKAGAGDVATMPVTALQVFALSSYERLLDLLGRSRDYDGNLGRENTPAVGEPGGIGRIPNQLRALFQRDTGLAERAYARLRESQALRDSREGELLHSLISVYAGPADMFVNYYGPPRSITTVPYYRILERDTDPQVAADIAGAAVFVGFSEQLQPEQKDGFFTVYSQASGLDVSGVEIAATTFANLLERRPVTQPTWGSQIMILTGWGLAMGLVLRILPGVSIVLVAMTASALYLGAAYLTFDRLAYWLPLVVPLLWQAPLAVVAALLWRYLDVQREKQNIRRAFDYHLPPQVVDELASGSEDLAADGRLTHGICLATDAEQYARLSEQLAPGELRELMNSYYSVIFEPVRGAGGIISDVIGDSMLAIWAAKSSEPHLRKQVCQAALAIVDAIDAFNRGPPVKARLPTRLGIHCGEIMIGHVGALDHFEYRAVGDIVNTATRIEGLNKQLGTRILASTSILEGLDGLIIRPVGRFLLAGKSIPLELHELVGYGDTTDAQALFHTRFGIALRAFRTRQWDQASHEFRACLQNRPQDGPSQYYLDLCRTYRTDPPDENWDGTLCMHTK